MKFIYHGVFVETNEPYKNCRQNLLLWSFDTTPKFKNF